MARPISFTPEIADEICERLAAGESLRAICRDEHIPDKTTVGRWLADKNNQAFRTQYAQAREAQADHYLEEIIEIADNATDDIRALGNNTPLGINASAIARARLQVDARKWVMSKLAPKKYGERITHVGDEEQPVVYKNLSDTELDARIAELTNTGEG